MRDALLITGTIAAATKATRAYSANTLDMAVAQNLGDVKNLYACFKLGEAVASGDSYTFEIHDSANNSDFALAVSGKTISSGAAGDIVTVPVPKNVRRYVKLGVYPASSGTLNAQDIDSWFEFR